MINRLFPLLVFSFFIILRLNGQGLMCESSEPFCTGSIYTFPAGTTGTAQYGANYGCLQTQPAPAWYHMLIDNPGNITIYMYSTPLVDIDFICWGPFADPFSPCVTGLTANTIVDCSYSPNPTEYCDIPNGQTGQYYVLLITNYSQQPCNITFSQTAGNGSTDCTILPPPVSNNGPLCVGDTLHLYAEFVVNASYWWSGPNGFLSAQQNPTIPNVTQANAGDYSCIITVNGQSSDPAITTVNIFNLPAASLLTGDTTICSGTPAAAIFNLVGWSPFHIHYTNGTNTFISPNMYGPRDTLFLSPTSPTTYTFTKVTDSHCERALIFSTMNVDTYPVTSGILSGSGSICAGEPAQLVFNLTGTPPWTITYTANGTNPQTAIANASPYTLNVFPMVNTTYAFSELEDIHCSGQPSGQAQFTVSPSPTAYAGTDQTLPYGANTVLQGSGGGGSGNYYYAWTPADKLLNPTVAQPTTVNLTETTLFTLTVTDNNGYCSSTDDVLVTITGGPLGCNPYATPQEICHNLTSQLYAMAGGGSGTYTYTWSSSPSGFSSTLQNPTVSPDVTTIYYVSVSDGYNVVNGNTTITVNPRPIPDAGVDQVIPHGTSTQLSGTGSGGSGSYSYHWEPANKVDNPLSQSPHTVNLYTTTLFTLYVTDMATGCSSETPAEVNIVISGAALSAVPAAEPDQICHGVTTTLHAQAGGGSGQYSYSWTSNPPGLISNLADPQVTPDQTTLYSVVVDDGYNQASGYVNVTVLDAPEINLGPQTITACVYDTIALNAGNAGSTFLWSNGSVDQTIRIATTGLGFESQTHHVLVTSPSGCQAEDSITVIFDFSECNGVEDMKDGSVRMYPNPGDGNLHLVFENGLKPLEINVFDILGEIVYRQPVSGNKNSAEFILRMSELPNGLYFVRVIADDQTLRDFKYVLSR